MLNYEFPPIGGGAGHAHRCLLERLSARQDLCMDVLTSGLDKGVHTEAMGSSVTIHRVGIHKKHLHRWKRHEVIEWLWRAGRTYRRLIKEQSYDLVHAFFAFPSGWLCYGTRHILPYIISLRGSDVPGRNQRLSLDYKLLGPTVFKPIWSRAAAIVACSGGLRERALRFLPSASIEVVPNGVDLDFYYPSKHTGQASERCRLITVGRLSETKRVSWLIDAVERLMQRDRLTLTVVGGGALYDGLVRTVAQKGLSHVVTFTGRIESERMPELYREHDVFVSASMQEGMSNAMLEAMASGLPIVTTACEGIEELIKDNGVVVPSDHVDALVEAIGRLVRQTDKRHEMAHAARGRALCFDWDVVADRYLEIYRRLV